MTPDICAPVEWAENEEGSDHRPRLLDRQAIPRHRAPASRASIVIVDGPHGAHDRDHLQAGKAVNAVAGQDANDTKRGRCQHEHHLHEPAQLPSARAFCHVG